MGVHLWSGRLFTYSEYKKPKKAHIYKDKPKKRKVFKRKVRAVVSAEKLPKKASVKETKAEEIKKYNKPQFICLSCCHYVKDNQLCLITRRKEKQRFHCLFYKLG